MTQNTGGKLAQRELGIVSISLIITLFALAGLAATLVAGAASSFAAHHTREGVEILVFTGCIAFLAYGNLLYQLCLAGYYRRLVLHKPVERDALEMRYAEGAPALSVLIPAYKEEYRVVFQTLMSAGLSEYPFKNVVLLIDDPYKPKVLEDMVRLEESRALPERMQALFDAPCAYFCEQSDAWLERKRMGRVHASLELNRLSLLFDAASETITGFAADFMAGKELEAHPHAERFFLKSILLAPAQAHSDRAQALRDRMAAGDLPDVAWIERQYSRLASLFNVRFSHFERKKYANLSHEANKAMNLNSYISVMGKSWKEEAHGPSLALAPCAESDADFTPAGADYVCTLDADSMVLSDYMIRLIHILEAPGNERVAISQTPYSAFPDCPAGLERTTSALGDVQFMTHQGSTWWNATSWVGASAMLRRTALEDIKETRLEDGNKTVEVYIQDRTVIEDTESTIDLVHRGWRLVNYPERMAYSATPPDFGSLLIQRRRWANGGLIILPKLIHHLVNTPKSVALVKETVIRLHYLIGSAVSCFLAPLLLFYPFPAMHTGFWLPLSMAPLALLYMYDLKKAGYTPFEFPRVYAFNLMMMPIVMGGVFKSIQQIVTGQKIPFGRTPKITGRTAAPALYCWLEVALGAYFVHLTMHYAAQGAWAGATFSFVNSALFIYALVRFIGIRAIAEDTTVAIRERWRTLFHHAQIIPISRGRERPLPPAAVAKIRKAG